MEHNVKEVVIKLNDGNRLEVSRETLTVESKIFRHLLDELKQDELQFDDFSPESVELFITLLKDRALGDIDQCQFRELNKLCVVFEVEVMQHGCKKWL